MSHGLFYSEVSSGSVLNNTDTLLLAEFFIPLQNQLPLAGFLKPVAQ